MYVTIFLLSTNFVEIAYQSTDSPFLVTCHQLDIWLWVLSQHSVYKKVANTV